MGRYSSAVVDGFNANGFAGPFDLYTQKQAAEIWTQLRVDLTDTSLAPYPGSNYDRHLDLELLSRHVCRPEIVELVQEILGPNVLAWRTELHPKPPGAEGTDWHQAILMTDDTKRPFLTWDKDKPANGLGGSIVVWTAFTDVTLQSAPMQFIPGSHTRPYYDEREIGTAEPETINKLVKDGVLRGFYGYDWRRAQLDPNWRPDEENYATMTMKAGQFVMFWSTVVHSSLPNKSKANRYATNVRYVPTGVQIYPGIDRVQEAYTAPFSLDNWGAVLVAGEDHHKLNRIVDTNRRGFQFPKLP